MDSWIGGSIDDFEQNILMQALKRWLDENENETKTKIKRKETENTARTENKRERRTSVDGEQAVAGLRHGIFKKNLIARNFLHDRHGLEY